MALQSSGEIRASQIRAEFGDSGRSRGYGNGSVSFGAYRDVNQEVTGRTGTDAGRNFTLDHNFFTDEAHIPRRGSTGSIKFSDFYDAKLNIVLAYANVEDPVTPGLHAYNEKYERPRTKAIGGFLHDLPNKKPDKTATGGSKIILYVNKKLGSPKGNRRNCALRTGEWPDGTEIHIEVSPNGKIYGSGGDGGSGGDNTEDGNRGKDGSSAISLKSYVSTIRVRKDGIIAAGGGGGGGGGGAKGDEGGDKGGGGGGGGGAGFPNSTGGRGGSSDGEDGSDGENGSDNSKGEGGNGGSQSSAQGGNGGDGGDLGSNGQGGTTGDASGGGNKTGDGADGGNAGFRFIRSSGISAPNVIVDSGGSVFGSDELGSEAANEQFQFV